MKVDAIGQEVNIGDTIAYSTSRSVKIYKGVISKFTPKGVSCYTNRYGGDKAYEHNVATHQFVKIYQQ